VTKAVTGAIEAYSSGMKIVNALEARGATLKSVMAAITGKQAVATVAQTTATQGATVASNALNKSLLANPIGLVVAAIVAAVGVFDTFSKSVESAADLQERLNAEWDEFNSKIDIKNQKKIKDIDAVIAQKKAEGASINEIASLELKKIEEIEFQRRQGIENTKMEIEDQRRAKKKAEEEGDKDKAKSIKAQITANKLKIAELRSQEGEYAASVKLLNTTTSKELSEDAKKINEQNKAASEAAVAKAKEYEQNRINAKRQVRDIELANMEDGINKEIAIEQEKYKRLIQDTIINEKLTADEKQKIKDQLIKQEEKALEAIRNKNNDTILAEIEAFNNKLNSINKVENDDKLVKLQEQYTNELNEIRKNFKDKEQLLILENALNAKYKKEKADLEKSIELEKNNTLRENEIKKLEFMNSLEVTTYEDKVTNLQRLKELELSNTELTETERLAIIEKYRKEEEDLEKEKTENKMKQQQAYGDFVSGTFDFIASISESNAKDDEKRQKKAFDIRKKADIANTLISTYFAAQQAYASQVAITTPDAPIRGAIAAGLAIAQGLARVSAISKTKFESPSATSSTSGGSGSGSGNVSTGQIQNSTPSFSLFGTAGAYNSNQSQQQSQTNTNQEMNISVSVEEINNVQNKVAKIKELSSL